MKFLILTYVIFAVSTASKILGLDKVRPIYEYKEWQDDHPALAALLSRYSENSFEGRIIGGHEATPHQFPYQVAVLSPFEHGAVGLCGGSIISDDFIMTAAHCVSEDLNVTILVAAHDRTVAEPNQFRVSSSNVIMHPDYNPTLIRNDIALIRLDSPLTFSEFVKPVLLPRVSQLNLTFTGEQSTISGWGRFSDNSTQGSNVLKWITVAVITNSACNQRFLGSIRPTNICAEQSICHGDSGGPLVLTDAFDEVIQVGIASFVIALGCERGWPAGFVRVTEFHDWIHSHTGSSLLPRL